MFIFRLRRVDNIVNDERGVSIVFACIAMVVLLIIGGIVIAYGYSNYNRALENQRQTDNYQMVSLVATELRDACEESKAVDAQDDNALKTLDEVAAMGAEIKRVPYLSLATGLVAQATAATPSHTVVLVYSADDQGQRLPGVDPIGYVGVDCAYVTTGGTPPDKVVTYSFTLYSCSADGAKTEFPVQMAFTIDVAEQASPGGRWIQSVDRQISKVVQ